MLKYSCSRPKHHNVVSERYSRPVGWLIIQEIEEFEEEENTAITAEDNQHVKLPDNGKGVLEWE